MKKVVISVGGTKGHLVFADRLAGELLKKDPTLKISFIGSSKKNCIEVPSGSISLKKPLKSIVGLYLCTRGFFKSIKYFKKERPDLVVGFGSYTTFPTLLAARALRIPFVLHEQNTVPGRVNRLFAKKALFTGLNMPLGDCSMKGKSLIVDIPIEKKEVLKKSAKDKLGFNAEEPLVLIFGGSQGALAINKMIYSAKKLPFSQVIHLTGSSAWTEKLTTRYRDMGIESEVSDFSENMSMLWQAADLVVSRAGAGTISEQLHFEVPALFIPYPYAKDNHQEKNADFIVTTVGGAVKKVQSEIDSNNFIDEIEKMLNRERLKALRDNIKNYKTKTKNVNFSSLIFEVLSK